MGTVPGDGTGLTPFIVAMMKAPRDKLAGADIAKTAAKYGVREDHARFYIQQWLRS